MFERSMTHLGMRASRAHVVANGTELARLYQSRRTLEVVSTSITEEDFLVRNDTCSGPAIRLLFVGFIRPEKGIEYLIRALPLVDAGKPIQLALVGSWDKFSSERDRLVALIGELGLTDMVSWENHAPFGRPLFDRMDRSDILVLPSLSEGTPRVLVEARARSLPIVSTLAGGIPDSVCDGEDGLLVPPRDAVALASAISRLVTDGALRRRLIRRGRERVKGLTVGHFADLVAGLLADTGTGGWEGVCSCGCLTMNGR
jgi:glycosyltransferase involved in cell wall biosynthesis